MKIHLMAACLFLSTGSLVAKPIEVFVAGKNETIRALFKKRVDQGFYDFVTIDRKDLERPRLKVPFMSSLPKELCSPNAEYKVMVALIINRDGKVLEATLVETTDDRVTLLALGDAARWIFKPATKDNIPVACCVLAPFEYKIKSWGEILK